MKRPEHMVLAAMIVIWSATFITLGWIRHTRYATLGFDLGIYDQGIWMLSRFREPFVTVKGLNLFGHHVNIGLILLAPFYWLGAGPLFLLIVQVITQALGAIAIYMLALDRLKDRWLAVACGAVLLLHPTSQFLAWEFFHPDTMAISPLLFAYWAARTKHWGWFTATTILALSMKEDVALAVLVLGILVAFLGNRRVGIVTAVGSAAWFWISTRLLIPAFNGIGPFYDSFFGDFGNSMGEVVRNAATNPKKTFKYSSSDEHLRLYHHLLAPVSYLPLIALPVFLIGAPMLATDALTTNGNARDPRYHYAALVLVGVILASVEAIWLIDHFLPRRRAVLTCFVSATIAMTLLSWGPLGIDSSGTGVWALTMRMPQRSDIWIVVLTGFVVLTGSLRGFLVGLTVATSLAATIAWGPSPIGADYRTGTWPLAQDEAGDSVKRAALEFIPDDAAVSSIYYLVPQITHRDGVYEFPEPWRAVNWGVRGENLHDPATIDWIVVDTHTFRPEDVELLEYLLVDEFEVRMDSAGIIVAQRVNPPVTT